MITFESKKETKRILTANKKLEGLFNDENSWSLKDYINYMTHELNIPMCLTKALTHSKIALNLYCSKKTICKKNVWEDDLFKLIYLRDTVELFKSGEIKRVDNTLPSYVFNEFLFDLEYIRGVCGYAIANKENIDDVKNAIYRLYDNENIAIDNKIFCYLTRTLNLTINKEIERRVYLNKKIEDTELKFAIQFEI